jgi:vacuolar iron transporter family protein
VSVRAGWLRAAVPGADDGVVSISSLMIGVAVRRGLDRELGIDQAFLARPMQAAWISAASFATCAVVPIVALLLAPAAARIPAIGALSLVSLAAPGAFGGHLGGAPLDRAAMRVTIGGALAMATTAAIERIVGIAIG